MVFFVAMHMGNLIVNGYPQHGFNIERLTDSLVASELVSGPPDSSLDSPGENYIVFPEVDPARDGVRGVLTHLFLEGFQLRSCEFGPCTNSMQVDKWSIPVTFHGRAYCDSIIEQLSVVPNILATRVITGNDRPCSDIVIELEVDRSIDTIMRGIQASLGKIDVSLEMQKWNVIRRRRAA